MPNSTSPHLACHATQKKNQQSVPPLFVPTHNIQHFRISSIQQLAAQPSALLITSSPLPAAIAFSHTPPTQDVKRSAHLAYVLTHLSCHTSPPRCTLHRRPEQVQALVSPAYCKVRWIALFASWPNNRPRLAASVLLPTGCIYNT